MTSPPAKHNPRDNGPGREDADAHPPLRQVEAGPQRHSDDPWMAQAREVIDWCLVDVLERPMIEHIAEALRLTDRAAREECARIARKTADQFAHVIPANRLGALRHSLDEDILGSIKG